jgi:TPP-dependent pyruvate/acetoin dehydrogenase alpha subunit
MLTRIFRKMAEIRYFEEAMAKAQDRIKCPVYLSSGQESIAATFSEIYPNHRVFPQHRGHSWYLAYGGSPEALRDEILGLETGCCRGMGGSSDIGCEKVEAHHGLLGENIPLGVGYCFGSGQPTLITFGDSALEEDYSLPAVGFAVTHKLPVLFVCEDNGLAILTPIESRRSWKLTDVMKSFGMTVCDIQDNPNEIIDCLNHQFFNIKTYRHKWHVGFGNDGKPEGDRLAYMRNLIFNAETIEKEAKDKMEALWGV